MSDANTSELYQQARQFLKEQKYVEAIDTYQRVLNTKPTEKKAHAGIAAAYFQLKKYQEAIQHFEELTRLSPADASPFINIGAIYNRQGEHKQALSILRRAIQKDKKSADAYYNMGIAHKGLNQLSMAVNAYKQAILFDPELVDAHFNLGNIYLEMKNHTQANLSFNRTLEIAPHFKKAIKALEILGIQTEKQKINPFGRLVDESTLRKKDMSVSTHEMTPEEREKDRKEIHDLCLEIKDSARLLVIDLKKGFAPSLLHLNRCISQGEKHYSELDAANSAFQKNVRSLGAMRKKLKLKMLQLRAHEELVNSIDLEDD